VFLHLGGNVVVHKKDIIAIIDSRTKISQATKEFLEIAEDEGFISAVAEPEKEKSFVVTTNVIYLSPISCATLKKRASFRGNLPPERNGGVIYWRKNWRKNM